MRIAGGRWRSGLEYERLSIVDPDGVAQPICSSNKDLRLAVNGRSTIIVSWMVSSDSTMTFKQYLTEKSSALYC